MMEGRLANAVARALRKKMTPQEVKLWVHFRTLKQATGWKFRRQVPVRGYIVDFACFEAKLIIELDGSQHGEADHAHRDRLRDAHLTSVGFTVLRFWNVDIDEGLDGVWRQIIDALNAAEGNAVILSLDGKGGRRSRPDRVTVQVSNQ